MHAVRTRISTRRLRRLALGGLLALGASPALGGLLAPGGPLAPDGDGLAWARPARTAATTPPRAELRSFACHTALDPADRSVAVVAMMRALSRPSHLAVQAVLQRRRGDGSWRGLPAGTLGSWLRPGDPTLGQRPSDMWIVKLPVQSLLAPAAYRFAVSFRWSDDHGATLATTRLLSPVCRQPELRADLTVVRPVGVTRSASRPGRATYAVRVRNRGHTAAGAFDVTFTDADGTRTQIGPGLAPARTVLLRFPGRSCDPAAPPRVVVDPEQRIDDANRVNNALTVSCS